MSDRIRQVLVLGLFGAVIAGIWTVGALKADLDGPPPNSHRLDPLHVQRGMPGQQTVRY